MTPLGRIALGLLLVLLDLRVQGLDVVPDVVGWVLVVLGLSQLVARCPALAPCRAAAVVAGALSLADLVHPTRTTTTGDDSSTTTTAAVPPDGLQGLLAFGSMMAALVVVVLLSLRLRDLATADGDGRRARTFGRFAVYQAVAGGTVALVSLVTLLTTSGSTQVEGSAAGVLALVVLAALLVEAAFLLTLSGARREPWAQRGGGDAVTERARAG